MAKLTNVRERVHQPFRDTLIRTSGLYSSSVQDRTDLFTQAGKSDGETNLKNGSTLPSDQSMVVLALRVFVAFRAPVKRGAQVTSVTPNYPASNGDYALDAAGTATVLSTTQAGITNGSAVANNQDVLRLYTQAEEQLLWSFGAGDKFSITSMPTAYFPYGGGLSGAVATSVSSPADESASDSLLFINNGTPDHTGILRLARAILLPPRQNIKCSAQIVAYPDGGNAGTWFSTQGSRNMLSLTSNLNVADLASKVISFTFDGLFSRDVQ